MQHYIHLSANYGGLENQYIKVNSGKEFTGIRAVDKLFFVNHPVEPTEDSEGFITLKRGIHEPI